MNSTSNPKILDGERKLRIPTSASPGHCITLHCHGESKEKHRSRPKSDLATWVDFGRLTLVSSAFGDNTQSIVHPGSGRLSKSSASTLNQY
jgi:hypothetical protein